MPIVTFAGLSPTNGGTGKDTFAINTAAWLAKAHNKSVVVVDLDPFGNMTERFAVTVNTPISQLAQYFAKNTTFNSKELKQILPKFRKLNFWLFPTNHDFDYTNEEIFQHVKEALSWTFDVVIFNLPCAQRNIDTTAISQSDLVFLVGTEHHRNLKKYVLGLNLYKTIVHGEMKILINRGFNDEDGKLTISAIQDSGHEIFAYALDDEKVFSLTRNGKAVVLTNPTLSFSHAVRKIGDEILVHIGEHTITQI
jgi:cellulose biosynthesis protein BcsQ